MHLFLTDLKAPISNVVSGIIIILFLICFEIFGVKLNQFSKIVSGLRISAFLVAKTGKVIIISFWKIVPHLEISLISL